MSAKIRKKASVVASSMLWLIVVGTGIGKTWNYQNEHGASSDPPSEWPH